MRAEDWICKVEWSLGNGQCPACLGHKPNYGWWTPKIGHKRGCGLANTMKRLGLSVLYESKNPERTIGMYCPSGKGVIAHIAFNDPDKERKLKLGKKQGL